MRSAIASRLDYAVLVALAAWSVVSLLVVSAAGPADGVFTGADGIVAIDQLQYLAWIREAAGSVLVSNRFDVGASDAVFLHPLFAASGLLYDAGLSVQAALLVWKPVAVVALFFGFRAYVDRVLGPAAGQSRRLAALVLALFFYYPIQSLLERASIGTVDEQFRTGIVTLELFPAGLLWGYLPSAIAIGLMPLFLIALERALDPPRRRQGRGAAWYVGWAAAAGLLTSWLHPWRGMVLIGIVAAVWALDRDRRRYAAAVIPLAAAAAPLAYYGLLSRLDSDWEHAAVQNAILRPPVWGLLLAIAPLAVVAALGTRRGPRDFQEMALVLWPGVSLAAYFVAPSFPSHALAGASLPLAVLAVRAWDRFGLPRFVAAAVLPVVVVPGLLSVTSLLRDSVHARVTPHHLDPGEKQALDHLSDARAEGGVLATPYLSMAVPGFTGRDSWLGNYLWTPDYDRRRRAAEALFAGRLDSGRAGATVRRAGVRFVLADCNSDTDLARELARVVTRVRHFGCATLLEVAPVRRRG